jgi:hypothetical protein
VEQLSVAVDLVVAGVSLHQAVDEALNDGPQNDYIWEKDKFFSNETACYHLKIVFLTPARVLHM